MICSFSASTTLFNSAISDSTSRCSTTRISISSFFLAISSVRNDSSCSMCSCNISILLTIAFQSTSIFLILSLLSADLSFNKELIIEKIPISNKSSMTSFLSFEFNCMNGIKLLLPRTTTCLNDL